LWRRAARPPVVATSISAFPLRAAEGRLRSNPRPLAFQQPIPRPPSAELCYNTHMHPQYEKADALTAEVIDAAVRVQRHFGIGLMESIYQKCLAHELRLAGHLVETEKPVAITYRGLELEENLRLDILVDGCLVVECKSLDEDKVNMPRHKAQLLSYMRLLNAPLGLVVNFGDSRLGSRGIARVILKGASSPDIAAP